MPVLGSLTSLLKTVLSPCTALSSPSPSWLPFLFFFFKKQNPLACIVCPKQAGFRMRRGHCLVSSFVIKYTECFTYGPLFSDQRTQKRNATLRDLSPFLTSRGRMLCTIFSPSSLFELWSARLPCSERNDFWTFLWHTRLLIWKRLARAQNILSAAFASCSKFVGKCRIIIGPYFLRKTFSDRFSRSSS